MLPITVDVARVRVILIGDGEAAQRRLSLLDGAGATRVEIFAERPTQELAAAAGDRLRRHLPKAAEIARAQLVFLAAVPEPAASRLRLLAARVGALVNVEDDAAHSDFHSAAVVRRGDLTIAISTGGRSPGLAAAIRRQIEASFGSQWAGRVERVAMLRERWRDAGETSTAIARLTTSWLDQQRGLG